jgi:hypothetical protein
MAGRRINPNDRKMAVVQENGAADEQMQQARQVMRLL